MNRFLHPILPVAVATFLFFSWASADAGVIFSENFNDISTGDPISPSNTDYTDSFNGTGTSQTATQDTGDIFGEGTSNIYNRTLDTSTSNSARINFNDDDSGSINWGQPDVITYSFDLFDASSGSNGAYSFRVSPDSDAQSNYFTQVNFAPSTGGVAGVNGAYSTNTLYRVDIVANTGGSTVNFVDGLGNARSVGADSFAVFLTDLATMAQTAVVDNVAGNGSQFGAGFESIAFQTFSGASGLDVYWDNVEVRDEAFVTNVIPEPASLLLLGLGGLALLRRRHTA